MKILLDTDILIEHLRGNKKVTDQINTLYQSGKMLAYSPITEAEIIYGLRSNERVKTEALLSCLECLSINKLVGRRAGDYLHQYSKSHGLETSDALIAATAAIYHFSLCTFNWKHYPMSGIQHYRIEK